MADRAMVNGKQLKMAQLSPTNISINTIAHNLANALDASAGLDPAMTEDLRVLLRLTAGEVDRIRKANRKAAAEAKRASGQAAKKPKTRSRAANIEAEAKPTKSTARSRRAGPAINGVDAH